MTAAAGRARRERHERAAARLAAWRDVDLAARLAAAEDDGTGGLGIGGATGVVEVEGTPVFTKRVPLTDRELARPRSTANLFDLPLRCQYGVGSPGFNAWRELAANETVSAAVLAGDTAAFPLLHHWRVLPGRPPVPAEHADREAAAAALGGGTAVRARLAALAAASSSLVLVWEHLPHPLAPWLAADPIGRATAAEDALLGIAADLRRCGLLHMDGHLGNLRLADGRVHLTDFGLATSPAFDLSPAERAFVDRHAGHDADHAAMRLVNQLLADVCGIGFEYGPGPDARDRYLARCARGDVPDDVPDPVAAVLVRHAPVAARMNALYRRLFGGDLDAEYPGG